MRRYLCVVTIIVTIIIIGLHYNGVVFLDYDKIEEFLNENSLSENEETRKFICTVYSAPIEKNYKIKYIVKIKDKKFYLYTSKKVGENLKYGEKIIVNATYKKYSGTHNYKGFDYDLYLKTQKIYGSLYVESVESISENNYNNLFEIISNEYNKTVFNIRQSFLTRLKDNLSKDTYAVGLRSIDW